MNALAKPVIPAVPATAVFAEVNVDDVSASPLNHRKIFNAIDELGEDIKVNGCRVPIKVRPWPGGKTKYQLVYGERRWRGAKSAGVKKLPALIQELNDTQVIEEQLVENVQREDVHPMEEADGYKELTANHGYSVQQIADKTGKSKAYIHARLKLCDIAGSAAKTAFLENKVNASVALIAARIPVPKLQDAFIKRVVAGESDDQMVNGEWIKVDRPLSFREAQLLAQKEFMLRLENAPFPIIDDKLVKGVGSCVGCLFRTGNQRELFDDVKSADVCTNPPCFAEEEGRADRARARRVEEGGQEGPVEDRGREGLRAARCERRVVPRLELRVRERAREGPVRHRSEAASVVAAVRRREERACRVRSGSRREDVAAHPQGVGTEGAAEERRAEGEEVEQLELQVAFAVRHRA
jgi:ParB/RepB/Spo0J family partition protein